MATKVDPRRATPEEHLARYRATGDPQALGALFDATAPVLFRIALSLCPDTATAEDALQETFLASLAHLDRHDPARPVTPWLVGILQNEVRMARRREGRRPDPQRMRVPLDPAAEGASGQSDDVRTAIEALEEPYRSVALLRWRYGLEPQEIAHVRDEAPGTTRSLLHRSLERLRGVLRGAPACFVLPTATAGLDAIRTKVLAEAATLAPPDAAAGGAPAGAPHAGGAPAAALGPAATAGIGAAGALVLAGCLWFALRPGSDGDAPGAPPTPPAVVAPASPPASETRPVNPDPGEPDPAGAPPARDPRDVDPADLSGTTPAPNDAVSPTPGPGLRATPPATAAVPPRESPSLPPSPTPPDLPDPNEGAGHTPPTEGEGRTAEEGKDEPPPPAGGAGTPSIAPDAAVALDRKVGDALKHGIAWLKKAQSNDGSWGPIKGNAAYDKKAPAGAAYEHRAGATALALYALLKSEVAPDDPYVRRGFKYLKDKHAKPGSAYEASMMLLAVTATADGSKKKADGAGERVKLVGDFRGWALRLQEDLLDKRRAAKTQGWRYQVRGAAPAPGGEEDLSSTQLAALALLAADRCGLPTPAAVWNDLIAFAMRQQEKDGPEHPRAVIVRPKSAASGTVETPRVVKDRARGFAYILSDTLPPDEGRATGGMTACGIGTIEIARYALALRKDRMDADPAVVEQAIWDGLAWLDLHWSPFQNPGKKEMNVYHLGYCYAVERAFDLLGFTRIGSRAWYPDMVSQILPRQTKHGFWDSQSAHQPSAVLDTSFALLVLSRSAHDVIDDPVMTQDGDRPAVDNR